MVLRQRRQAAIDARVSDFDRFYRETWPDVVAYCAGLLGDRAAGEEAAQDAFARVYPRWQALDDPRPYVFRVAGNLCGRHRKLRSRVVAHGLAIDVATSPQTDEVQRLLVEEAVRRLPLKLRQVLLLHYYADLSVSEVAEVLRRPSGTVKRQLHDARDALGRSIGEEGSRGDDDGSR